LLLFFYLTKLIREFVGNNYISNYKGIKEGTENVCFDRCIKIIKRALNLGVKQAIEGITKILLSL
jgi:hypothetical protein